MFGLQPLRFTELVRDLNVSKSARNSSLQEAQTETPLSCSITRKDRLRFSHLKAKPVAQAKYLDYTYLDEFVRDRVLWPEKTYEKGARRCAPLTSQSEDEGLPQVQLRAHPPHRPRRGAAPEAGPAAGARPRAAVDVAGTLLTR
jgi:hypothetical protein